MGNHLTRMANVFEAIERTRHTHYPGAGGGIDSLPKADQLKAALILQKGMDHLRRHPPHVVTRELTKNAHVANNLGRSIRAEGMARMLEFLVDQGIAQPLDEFMATQT